MQFWVTSSGISRIETIRKEQVPDCAASSAKVASVFRPDREALFLDQHSGWERSDIVKDRSLRDHR